MRKALFTAFAMTLGATTVSAQQVTPLRPIHSFSQTLSPLAKSMMRQSEAADSTDSGDDDDESATSMMFGYSYDCAGGLGGQPGYIYGLAMQLTDAVTQKFDGCRITGIQIATSDYDSDKVSTPAPVPITLFMADELGGENIMTQDVEEDLVNHKTGEWVEYTLNEPYTIEAGRPIYIGYTLLATDYYYPLTMDNTKHTGGEPGGWMGYTSENNKEMKWIDYSGYYGFACIRIHIEGENLPTNELTLDELYAPTQTEHGSGLVAEVKMTNAASNPIRSVGVTYTINSGEPMEATINLSEPLTYSRQTVGQFEVKYDGPDADNIHVEFKLDKVNGVTNNSDRCSGDFYTQSLDYNTAFTRNMLVEEGTGTWCQWCVRGIVAMEAMKTGNYDAFIPVAAHYADLMTIDSYKPVIRQYFSGFPAAMINRDFMEFGEVDPTTETLKAAYTYIERRLFSLAKVEIPQVEKVGTDSLNITSKVTFSVDNPNATYRMDYVVTEDQVGPYVQENGYSGGTAGAMEGWEKLDYYVAHTYDDVARAIANGYGVEGSVPDSVEAGKEYEFTQGVSLANVTTLESGEKKLEDCHIIAMLINTTTGRIENSVTVPAGSVLDLEGGIHDVTATSAADNGAYYNLQGIAVSHPTHGIYIHNGKTIRL
jgi:hypothetical protein